MGLVSGIRRAASHTYGRPGDEVVSVCLQLLCDFVGIRQGIVTSRQWISGIFCQSPARYIQKCAKGAVGEITWSEPQSRYAARDARPISATPFRDAWLALKAL